MRAEGAIYNTMIARGDKLVKHVLHNPEITLYFEDSEKTKYIIDIRPGLKDNETKEDCGCDKGKCHGGH